MLRQKTQDSVSVIGANEKLLSMGYAGMAGVGTTAIFSTATWFAVTPDIAAGLSLGIYGATAVAAFTGVGVASAVVAIPVAWFTYKSLRDEMNHLRHQIMFEVAERDKQHHKLFFEMLRLRSFCESEAEFKSIVLHHQTKTADVNKSALIGMVNRIYKQSNQHEYLLESHPENNRMAVKRVNQHVEGALSLEQMLKNQVVLSSDRLHLAVIRLLRHVHDKKAQDAHDTFEQQLNACFNVIPKPPIAKRALAALYGTIVGLTVGGATLGVGWSFSALIVGAGLAASMPVVGWGIFAAICLVLGVAFGVAMGLEKQKNNQREALIDQLKKCRIDLKMESEEMLDICLNKILAESNKHSGEYSPRSTENRMLTTLNMIRDMTHARIIERRKEVDIDMTSIAKLTIKKEYKDKNDVSSGLKKHGFISALFSHVKKHEQDANHHDSQFLAKYVQPKMT